MTAIVVPVEGTTMNVDALQAHAKRRLAGYKVPKRFVEMGQLPKTSTGKIQKRELRARVNTDRG